MGGCTRVPFSRFCRTRKTFGYALAGVLVVSLGVLNATPSRPASPPAAVPQDGVQAAAFNIDSTGQPPDGRWTLVDDAAAGVLIEHAASDQIGKHFSVVINESSAVEDFELSVRVRTEFGRSEQAGVALRLTAPDDYHVVRMDGHRGTVSFSHIVGEDISDAALVEADISGSSWQALKIKAERDRFTVWLNGAWLFTAYDETLPPVGKIALWTTAQSTTRFSDFEVVPNPPRTTTATHP